MCCCCCCCCYYYYYICSSHQTQQLAHNNTKIVAHSVLYLSGTAGVVGTLPRETSGERTPTDCSDVNEPANGDGNGDAVLERSRQLRESEYWMLWYSWPIFCIRCSVQHFAWLLTPHHYNHYTMSKKNCANLFFVRTLSNFDRLWKFLAQR